jgi:ABC-type branched-subunit amino acid transport system ATPase component
MSQVADDERSLASTLVSSTPTGEPVREQPILEATNVGVRFGGTIALVDVTVSVPTNGIVGLIGPNGAGKSTLFNVLSGLKRPDSGQVLMNGDDVTGASPENRALRGMARTFQHTELFLGLNVYQHLVIAYRAKYSRRRIWTDLLIALPSRWKTDPAESREVETLIAMLGLGSVAHQPVAGLPLGTARLIEVGRALATGPSILLLDEPSSGLDVRESEQLRTALNRASEERSVAMVIVEHDLQFVMDLCRKIYLLDYGKLIAQGSPAEIRSNPAAQAAYLGTTGDS